MGAVGYMIYFETSPHPLPARNGDQGAASVDVPEESGSFFFRVLSAPRKNDSPAMQVSFGEIVFYDIAGNIRNRTMAAISQTGWVAIPTRLGIGGHAWRIRFPRGDGLEIDGGILGDQDDVGLWQAHTTGQMSGPPVFPAAIDAPMIWVAMGSDRRRTVTGLRILAEQQNFYHVIFDEEIDTPGVLLQNRKIVGWTFGGSAVGAYLWKGPDESNLVYELSVADFYRLTFQNSREEQFMIAYSMENMPLTDQLAAFARGFQQEPVLFRDNTPAHLTTGAVVEKMRALISDLVRNGQFYHVLPFLDSRVLAESGDVLFLMDVLTFGAQVGTPEAAVDILESVLLYPGNFDDVAQGRMREFQKTLYDKWLNHLINTGDYEEGLAVYRRAAEAVGRNPEILLTGVRMALVFNDWKTAEAILASGRFPAEFTERIRDLEARIAELKFQDDKIVIRFPAGSGKVSLSARVNTRADIEFLVDTGASMVTIPSAAARQLGIHVSASTPKERLVTAGGVIEAPRVTLDAVTIDGWTERHIFAYVVDIPEQPGIGLLGLNFLNRFRMDLNTQAGVLTLAPR